MGILQARLIEVNKPVIKNGANATINHTESFFLNLELQ